MHPQEQWGERKPQYPQYWSEIVLTLYISICSERVNLNLIINNKKTYFQANNHREKWKGDINKIESLNKIVYKNGCKIWPLKWKYALLLYYNYLGRFHIIFTSHLCIALLLLTRQFFPIVM